MAIQYNPSVVTEGMVLCLDSANRKSAQTTGTTWINLVGYAGCTNANGVTFVNSNFGVFSYDGVDDHTILPASLMPTGAQITISLWQNISNVSTRSSFYTNAAAPNYYRVFQAHVPWSDNTVYWDAGAGTGTYDRISKATTAAERTGWHNWVFTKNATAGTMRIYLDGALWHSGTSLTANIATSSFAYLGGAFWDGFWFSGTIGYYAIYNIELNIQQISQNFNAIRGRFGI